MMSRSREILLFFSKKQLSVHPIYVLANALAADDLGFEGTFFYVTSAIFGQNRDF